MQRDLVGQVTYIYNTQGTVLLSVNCVKLHAAAEEEDWVIEQYEQQLHV